MAKAKKKTSPTLLIDGDMAVYKATISAEREVRWSEDPDSDLWILWTDLARAKLWFENHIYRLEQQTGASGSVIFLSGSTNFRKDIYPEYKANRADKRKPLGFTEFRGWVMDNFAHHLTDGIEADDAMGIAATDKTFSNPVIVSDDKDLQQIPGYLLRQGDVVHITPASANFYFLLQVLMGDATDNYPGCPGIGPKKAHDALMKSPTWDTVLGLYEKAGLTLADAVLQARIARILQAEDWDNINQKVKLWNPSSKMAISYPKGKSPTKIL